MPNWCSNYATFNGERAKEVADLFREGENYNNETHHGWTPKFLGEPDKYFFDISGVIHEREGMVSVRFETKWAPSIEEFTAICNHFGMSGELDYEELAMGIYGKYTYDPELGGKDVYLDPAEFDSVEYDEENDTYHYDGQTCDSQYEFLENILEKKLKS